MSVIKMLGALASSHLLNNAGSSNITRIPICMLSNLANFSKFKKNISYYPTGGNLKRNFSKYFFDTSVMRLCHPPDGSTSPKYKLLCFITTKKICKENNALAFNWDRCCHLVLCLQLIPFQSVGKIELINCSLKQLLA